MFNMSCREEKPGDEQEEEQEDFYDCQETLQHLDLRVGDEDKGAPKHIETDRLMDRRDNTENERGIQEERQQEERLQGGGLEDDGLQGGGLEDDGLQEVRQQDGGLEDDGLQEVRQQDGGLEDDGLQKVRQQDDGLQEVRQQDDGLQEVRQQDGGLEDDGLQEVRQQDGGLEDDGLQEVRQQDDGLQEVRQQDDDGLEDNSELEMKEEAIGEAEFDDEYLKEVEMELTEEEKESRRQQSLSLKERGNSQFKSGDWTEAEQSYKEALVLCPVCFSRERAVLFSNRAAARLHLDLKDQAIADCTRAIELNPEYVRALLRRAELYEQTEKLDEALEDYKKVLDLDPNLTTARQACMRLPGQIQERNEKLKEEMLGKLKDLGNLVLRPFGLSTNNFQVNQDAQTGSYSINFVQNPNNNNT